MHSFELTYGDNKKKTKFTMNMDQTKQKFDFLLFSSGEDPDTSSAIALYIPESDINNYQLVGINSQTNKIEYKEDRRIAAKIFFSHRIKRQMRS